MLLVPRHLHSRFGKCVHESSRDEKRSRMNSFSRTARLKDYVMHISNILKLRFPTLNVHERWRRAATHKGVRAEKRHCAETRDCNASISYPYYP